MGLDELTCQNHLDAINRGFPVISVNGTLRNRLCACSVVAAMSPGFGDNRPGRKLFKLCEKGLHISAAIVAGITNATLAQLLFHRLETVMGHRRKRVMNVVQMKMTGRHQKMLERARL